MDTEVDGYVHIYIYIYGTLHGLWFGAFDLYVSSVLCLWLLLGCCAKIQGVPYVYMICLPACMDTYVKKAMTSAFAI